MSSGGILDPKASKGVKSSSSISSPGRKASVNGEVFHLKPLDPPEFSTKALRSDISPDVDVSQKMSNLESTGFVSKTVKDVMLL